MLPLVLKISQPLELLVDFYPRCVGIQEIEGMRTTIASTRGVGNVEQQIGGVDIAGLITRLHKHRAGTPLLKLGCLCCIGYHNNICETAKQ